MKYFAKLDENNNVTEVIALEDGNETDLSNQTGEKYRETSYNTHGGIYYNEATGEPDPDQSKAFRKNFAFIGNDYSEERDAFIQDKPFPSWLLDDFSCLWYPPVPYPNDGKIYCWNEETLTWDEVKQ